MSFIRTMMVEMGVLQPVSDPLQQCFEEISSLRDQVSDLKTVMELMIEQQRSSLFRDGLTFLRHQLRSVSSGFKAFSSSLTWRDWLLLTGVASYAGYRYMTRVKKDHKDPKITLAVKASKVFESARPGSVETKLLKPKCQFVVGNLKDNGDFEVHGCGIRMENCLIIPDHVYSEQDKALVKITGKQKYLDLKTMPYPKHIDTDILMIDMSNNASELSMMEVSKATICHEMSDNGNQVTIVGPIGLGTTGILKWTEDDFGVVEYSGTTAGGYSGAPYMKGDHVIGIHLHGGRTNGGYSASYIYAMMNYNLEIVNETDVTVDSLRQYAKNKKRIRIDATWHDLDRVRIAIGNKVRIVERATVREAFPREEWDQHNVSYATFTRRGNQFRFDDNPSLNRESANFQNRPRMFTVSPTFGENDALDTKDLQLLINQLLNCSTTKLKKILSLMNSNTDSPAGSGQTTPPRQS